ncbi:MAG: 16S rRNA (guanine(527)-N(7))-methyltransferase RsmG [Ruminococcus sp.]|nr:16S rRNA (guanine(527)-N(7))-methyltransferase RsmG [Ruminococcus sp.]
MLPDFELSRSEFLRYDLTLTQEKYDKFSEYARFLVEYNENVNLTALTEPMDILVKHFIDSCYILNLVEIPQNASVIDVGTGAGFPSVPLKIMRPDLNITLLDSLSKRIVFLNQLCDRLDIRCRCVHGRAEDIAKLPEYRENFDFSCARAVANLSVLAEYCLPFVKIGGCFLSLKGPNEDVVLSEYAISTLGGKIDSCNDYTINSEDRRLIVAKKISHTSTKYPRKSAQIKRKSL